MQAHNKAIAAIVSTLLIRWFLRWTGLDLEGLGVASDFKTLVEFGIDAASAGLTGFLVWFIPNVRKRWNALEQRWEKHTDPPEPMP